MAERPGNRLLVGTRDGLFVLESEDRRAWARRGPLLAGRDVGAVAATNGRLYAGTKADGLFRSDDGGAAWRELPLDRKGAELNAYYLPYQNPFSPNGTDESSIWAVEVSPHDPEQIYVGVLPAALFGSADGGASWREVDGLRRLPQSREFWGPFGAGFLHSIVLDAATPGRVAVGISVGGVFRSEDAGESWCVANDGMARWEIPDAQFPEVHQDVHKLAASPADPRWLYTTMHGPLLYRSEDGGRHWTTASLDDEQLVTRPIALHPRDPERLWLVPLAHYPESNDMPVVRGQLRVLESRDGGHSFLERSAGLPVGDCNVYRDGLASDHGEPAGVYLGTSRGELYQTFEDGATWDLVAADLPPIRVVRAV